MIVEDIGVHKMQVYIPYFRLQVQITHPHPPLFHWTWRGFAYDQPLVSNFCQDFLHLQLPQEKWRKNGNANVRYATIASLACRGGEKL